MLEKSDQMSSAQEWLGLYLRIFGDYMTASTMTHDISRNLAGIGILMDGHENKLPFNASQRDP